MNVEDVHEVGHTTYQVCWCQNDLHRRVERSSAAVPGKPEVPHLIAVRLFERSWRVVDS